MNHRRYEELLLADLPLTSVEQEELRLHLESCVDCAALEVGRRLSLAFKREWHPATQAGLGTLLLSFVIYAVALILPCLGFIVGALVWMLGLGAVILTRFGGQESLGAPPPVQIEAA